MAEPIKNRKVSLREVLDEIAEDEAFTDAERQQAREKAFESEYQEWLKEQSR